MTVRIVDPPRVRPAGSLDLLEEDIGALRAFRSFVGAGAWYEREAGKVLRRGTQLLAQGELGDRDRILLAEWDDELLGVAVFSEESSATAHLGFVGITSDAHGARIDGPDGDRLSTAFLEATLGEARRLEFTRVTAQVARAHGKSRALVQRVGFQLVSRFDHDYDLFAISLV